MRTIRFLLQKEFLQIFRNRGMLPIIFALPLIQLLLLAFAANYEIKNISLDIVASAPSPWSRQLAQKITASGYFRLERQTAGMSAAMQDIAGNRADLILVLPGHFGRDMVKEGRTEVQVLVNAINGMKAGIAAGYLQNILQDFNRNVRLQGMEVTREQSSPAPQIEITDAYWYNPQMDYKQFMVPGILVALVTMIGAFLSGMNVVREKETGTMEQLNVTPIRKMHFITGKLLPFWIIGLAELAVGLLFAKWIFHLSFNGNVGLVFLFAAVYLPVMLGMGLLISTRSDTQQQTMFITWFFFVIFLLMSGLFTPVESMPLWAQRITWFNPIAWFIKVIRMVLLKGSTWSDIRLYFMIVAAFAVVINGIAVMAYRKRS